MVLKSALESSCKFKTTIYYSISKVRHHYLFGVYLLNFIIMNILLFKLEILIITFFFTLMILPYVCDI
jgi:hypothetical protein